MTAVSILRSLAANAANLKTDTSPEQSRPALESVFKGQLDEAIQSWVKGETKDTRQESESDADAREPDGKKEDQPQLPILVAVLAAILPAPLPASFGLPTAGLEPGSNNDGASIQTEAIANVEPTAAAPADKTAPPAPQADLAFALRLVNRTATDVAIGHSSPTLATGQPDPVRQAPTSVAPPLVPSVPPARSATPAPAILSIAQQNGTAAESELNQSSDGASNKEPPAQPPNPAPQRAAGRAEPEPELKPLRESGATSAPPDITHKEIPLPMPGPPHTAMVSVSNTSVPGPPVGASATPTVPTPAAVRNNSGSEVTDVSVTLPVPRADSSGDDRVAIRMVQKGAEIHVSVRTPDNQLSQTLRQDLGRLATGLDEAGFRTETWRPVVTGVAAPSQSSGSQESSQGSPNRDNAGPDGRSGEHAGQSPGEQKRRQQDQRPRWVAELEQYKNQ